MATRAQISKVIDANLVAAATIGKARQKRGDLAVSVAYEPRSKRLHVELASGVAVIVPVCKVQGLTGAKSSVVRTVEIVGKGYGLHWPALDLDVSVPDLVAGCFGTKAWMAALARQGGRVTSSAKAAAARRNGKKGGRPPRTPVPVTSAVAHG
jgi:hypothetical protein